MYIAWPLRETTNDFPQSKKPRLLLDILSTIKEEMEIPESLSKKVTHWTPAIYYRSIVISTRHVSFSTLTLAKSSSNKERWSHSTKKKKKKYFRKDEFYYCHDPDKKCKTGDIVLIEALPQKLTKLITHKVKEVVYPFGDITDPITGKKVAKERYREDIERETELYGKKPSAFDYDKAPPRGWQDGKKDFTSKPTYTKFHVFDENDPYAI